MTPADKPVAQATDAEAQADPDAAINPATGEALPEEAQGKDLSQPVDVSTDPGSDALPAGQRPPTAESVALELATVRENLANAQGGYDAYEAADSDLVRDQNRDAWDAYKRLKAREEHLAKALSGAS